jgi:hypothetical protein
MSHLMNTDVAGLEKLRLADGLEALRREVPPPPSDQLLQAIADRLDLVVVGERVFGLFELSPDMLDQLAAVGADAAEAEPGADEEDDDPGEPASEEDGTEDGDPREDVEGAPWPEEADAVAEGDVTPLPFAGHADLSNQDQPAPAAPVRCWSNLGISRFAIGTLRGKRVFVRDLFDMAAKRHGGSW